MIIIKLIHDKVIKDYQLVDNQQVDNNKVMVSYEIYTATTNTLYYLNILILNRCMTRDSLILILL